MVGSEVIITAVTSCLEEGEGDARRASLDKTFPPHLLTLGNYGHSLEKKCHISETLECKTEGL